MKTFLFLFWIISSVALIGYAVWVLFWRYDDKPEGDLYIKKNPGPAGALWLTTFDRYKKRARRITERDLAKTKK